MHSFFSVKAVRWLLAISVSIWMAGGCLFGCSGSAMGAESEHEAGISSQAVVAGESCHAARSHDCCASQKPEKKASSTSKQPKGLTSFMPIPRGAMKDCPLIVNGTAATSKNSSHLPDPGRAQVFALTLTENKLEPSNTFLAGSYLPNRGLTYLRCCVFLI
jgi:hypothetical protein